MYYENRNVLLRNKYNVKTRHIICAMSRDFIFERYSINVLS